MGTQASQRVAPNRVALILILLVAAWLVFSFLPKRMSVSAPALPSVAAESKLDSVGLANNPDWMGLPDYFAVWAGSLPWENETTVFAYWSLGGRRYADFFSATRGEGGYRFRVLSRKEVSDWATEFFEEGEEEVAGALAADVGQSPTHPFIFLSRPTITPPQRGRHHDASPWRVARPSRVEVKIDAPHEILTDGSTP